MLTITANEGCCSHSLFLLVSHIGESKLSVQFDGKLSPILTDFKWIAIFSLQLWVRAATVQVPRYGCPGNFIGHS